MNSAIKINEEYTKAYIKRSDLNVAMENFEEGVRDLEKAYVIDPSVSGLKEKIRHVKAELKKSKRKDYYKIMNIAKDATEEEIKKAYKRQALTWHPDKHSNGTDEAKEKANVMFKDIGEAYAVLSDTRKRHRYDQGADIEDLENEHSGMGGGGVNPNDIFQMFFSQGGMGGGGHGHSHGGTSYSFR